MIEAMHLTKSYGKTRALDDLSLSMPEKTQVLALIGPSGGGKSTFLRILAGLEVPESGTLEVLGAPLPLSDLISYRRRTGFLFQSYQLFPHLSVCENIALPLRLAHQWSPRKADNQALDSLARFGIADQAAKKPSQLSGGQRQRVALARAIAHSPDILFLDEPTSALDPLRTADILDLIKELAQTGQRIVLSTHEMGFARRTADHIAYIESGRVAEAGEPWLLSTPPADSPLAAFLARAEEYAR
jgi:polar amino acid transport system ATP-binding protein